uniref:Helitron helicase-like domain-containing protein n=1 Tax=Oryza rufipogon TaxID=4529 RepID=A0A0E0RC29_ORYRU
MGSVPNLDDYRISLNTNIVLDQRVYNAPTASQVAAIWIDGNDPRNQFDRSVIVFGRENHPHYIKPYHGNYDPLSYPLFFPGGEVGWNWGIPYDQEPLNEHPFDVYQIDEDAMDLEGDEDGVVEKHNGKYVTAREYYCYKLQICPGIFNVLFYGGRLFQQIVVDIYMKIEGLRLDFFLRPETQKLIRADLYQGVVDTIASGETRAAMAGKRIVLPASFTGGERDMKRRFFDAMALVQRYGKPCIFMTMTCNPHWEEIVRELAPGQSPQDRPDLVARVFRAKLRDIKELVIKKHYFGEVAAYVHVTEFQKRGLPHEHFLLIMKSGFKITTPDQYDAIISAELPDESKYRELHRLVVKHMLHGPCGSLKKDNTCMVNGSCRFRYPRQFSNATQQGKDSYPIYRRRNDRRGVKVWGAALDNRWVVPYNPGLLMRFNCHINVEICSSIKSVKYLFKYLCKGHDRASFSVDVAGEQANVDEIRMFRDARFIGPAEAMYRIYHFNLFEVYPPVLQLQLHLPGMHMVTFRGSDNLEDVVAREAASRTMLTEYFRMNQVNSDANNYLYREFPEHFVWQKGEKIWTRRKTKKIQIGRLVAAHPSEGERYFLRVLLNHVRGAKSPEDLRSFDGVTYPSFRLAAEKRGLIETDKTIDDCMLEATNFQMPSALRRLFATILVFCEATNIREMWDKHLDSMSEDYQRNQPNKHLVEQRVLRDIRDLLHSMGKDISSYGLPDIEEGPGSDSNDCKEVLEEMSIHVEQSDVDLYGSLNPEQQAGLAGLGMSSLLMVQEELGKPIFIEHC